MLSKARMRWDNSERKKVLDVVSMSGRLIWRILGGGVVVGLGVWGFYVWGLWGGEENWTENEGRATVSSRDGSSRRGKKP